MNKNDLRFQKTEIAIKSTYLALKKRGSTTVKVKELCEAAMINKTTFYAHYETIEHLHKAVCKDFVSDMITQNHYIDSIQTSISDLVYAVLGMFMENMDIIEKLYGNDLFLLVNDAENILMEYSSSQILNEEYELAIKFCIGGAFRLLAAEHDPKRIQITVELVEKVLS
jgi:AcrR family transcriptional regulator